MSRPRHSAGNRDRPARKVGELDAFTVSQFRQTFAELASSPHLLIDLSGVPFVDSAGLGALIGPSQVGARVLEAPG